MVTTLVDRVLSRNDPVDVAHDDDREMSARLTDPRLL
jgi:hypothetical protein